MGTLTKDVIKGTVWIAFPLLFAVGLLSGDHPLIAIALCGILAVLWIVR